MKLFLNAGFGALLGRETLAKIKGLGFSGVRQDVLRPEGAEGLVEELYAVGLGGLFIVRDVRTALFTAEAAHLLPGMAIEFGNEEDSKQTPKAYHRWLMEAVEAACDGSPTAPPRGVSLFTAGITTTDRKRLDWLREVYALGVPSYVHTAIHTYRTTVEPWVPHKGFRSRAEEYRAVREIIGPRRRLIVSEVGWHTAPSIHRYGPFGLFGRRVQLTDADVARYAVEECRIAAANGVEALTYFQLNDGADPTQYEHRFGVQRLDGTLKPVAVALKAWSEAQRV